MASQRHVRGTGTKRAPLSFPVKVAIAMVLGLAFFLTWSMLSPSSPADQVSTERRSFDSDLADVSDSGMKHRTGELQRQNATAVLPAVGGIKDQNSQVGSETKRGNEPEKELKRQGETKKEAEVAKESKDQQGSKGRQEKAATQNEKVENAAASDELEGEDPDPADDINAKKELEMEASDDRGSDEKSKKTKKLPPLFDPGAHYRWKQCSTKSGPHYIPCIDLDGDGSQRHHERSCPRTATMCLVSLPKEYKEPAPWSERESKVWYNNVGHPRLSAYVKRNLWLNMSRGYLVFPEENSEFKNGALHYVDHIAEMIPDIEWGKNIRLVLDVGCTGASFGAALHAKNVISLTLGLMNDQTNLAQIALERGFTAVVAELGSRRLPFPSGAFDAIHCGGCKIPWNLHGGRLLIEMNRILRPGGYFVVSTKHVETDNDDENDTEEGSTAKGHYMDSEEMSSLMAALCWHVVAYEVDDSSEMAVKVYQRPSSNDVYNYRRTSEPPFCKENGNNVAVWYTPIGKCLHKVPQGIEDRGSNWPEDWPKRLWTFPEWLGELQERLASDNHHWKAVVERSYLDGMGINWTNVRNVMDMRATYGGFAAALTSKKVWVMNVVPAHAPDTLPIIFERGLLGIYHDWCESFSSFPRSYDLLHADHLFSRLKNRCKKPVAIVAEMDRLLRPGGWAIIRDRSQILDPLELILKSLHWDIKLTYGHDKEGIICAQKTTWRP